MVKAMAIGTDGRAVIVLGVSEENIKRIKQGDPIYFDPAALRIVPGTAIGGITLFYGSTDAELTRTLRTLIGPQTDVIVVPRGDDRQQ